MSKIIVYKVRFYDITTDERRISRRMATEIGAQRMGGEIVEQSGIEIPVSDLEAGEDWTPIGYTPNPRGGFQSQVY